jgi:N-methylhydantoinase B
MTRAPEATRPAVVRDDPFTVAVIEDALTAIGDEMFVTTQRTSQTPLVYEVLDFCVGVTDPDGNLVSQGNGVTLFLATLTAAARSVLEKFPPSGYKPGDIFITNDAYGGGGTHPSDMTLVMPVLVDDRLVGFTLNKAHWIDVGGKDPGTVSTDTTDIFQEGLQLPCVRLFAGGSLNEAVLDVIRANVRFPDLATGDLYAQVAAVRVGAARLEHLCAKYGVDLVHRAMRQRFDRSATLARAELAKLPPGTYDAEDFVESPDGPLPIRVSVTVSADTLVCDFTGTHGELGFSQNLTRTGLDSAARLVFKAITSPDTPLSDGSFEALEVICPPRTMFTAERPAPISAYWETLSRASDLIWKALAPVIPHRLTAGHFLSVSAEVIVGTHLETGEPFILFEPNAGGWGAGLGLDGERGLVGVGDGETYILPVEVAEHQYALRVEQYA